MDIAEEIRSIMGEWSLSLDHVSAVTTANASDMVLAMNTLGFHVFQTPCN